MFIGAMHGNAGRIGAAEGGGRGGGLRARGRGDNGLRLLEFCMGMVVVYILCAYI